MSDKDTLFTNEELTELALMQAESTAQIEKILSATAHQAIAGLVINALLMQGLERLGLVDRDSLMEEAVQRARSIQPPGTGASVAQVIKAILEGELPAAPASDFTVVNNGQTGEQH